MNTLRAIAFAGATALGAAVGVPAQAQDIVAEWEAHLRDGARAYGLALVDIAEREMNAALAIAEKNFPPDDPRLAATLINVMPVRMATGNLQDLVDLGVRAVPLLEKQGGATNPELMPPLNMMAAAYRDLGRFVEADKAYLRSIALHDEYFGDIHPRTVTMLEARASMLHRAGRDDEAVRLFTEVVEMWAEALGHNHIRQSVSLRGYAQMMRDLGRTADAATAEKRANDIVAVIERGR